MNLIYCPNFGGNYIQNVTQLPLQNLILFIPLFFIFGFLLNGAITTLLGIYSGNKNSNHLMFLSNIFNFASIYFAMFAATNPDHVAVLYGKYIPFVSYLTIPTLLPYGLHLTELLLALFILILSTIGIMVLSAKVYKKPFSLQVIKMLPKKLTDYLKEHDV
ncbi:hypothetical protein J8281_13110 [Aquimarina sp. U1-2]|uniref:hypothetical protein n=1 Tax=Aquimarina sp. U1-2 TaxID=2823141 RepID=UPI001AEC9F64|nr:hypothetical protein [Aquimarina sp. U1-2]MBP2833127.1 hypothetical protein [Aquimarina sp. U1-2]